MRHLFGIILLCGPPALAHAQATRGFYAGAGLGRLSYEEASETSGEPISKDSHPLRLLAGYRFNDRYAVEAGFETTADIERTFSASTVRGLGIVPLSAVSLYGGVGYYEATFNSSLRIQSDFSGLLGEIGNEPEDSDAGIDDRGATVTAGVMFDLRRIGVRGEYAWFDTKSEIQATSVAVLVLLRF